MMKIKKTNILIILLFLVAIISLGSVAATDDVSTNFNNKTDIVSEADASLSVANDTYVNDVESSLVSVSTYNSNSATGTYKELYNKISSASSGSTIYLDKDYTYSSSSDYSYKNGITINKNLIIEGNGYTINGANTAAIFLINGQTVTFRIGF